MYLVVPKTAQLYVTGVALLYVEKDAEYFGRGSGHYCETQLDQDTVLVGRYLYVRDLYPGITTGHSLYLTLDVFLGALDLILKQEIPYAAAIGRSTGQFTLPYVESIEQVTLDEIKIGQGKLLLAPYGAETNESSHRVFTPVLLRPISVAVCLEQFQAA